MGCYLIQHTRAFPGGLNRLVADFDAKNAEYFKNEVTPPLDVADGVPWTLAFRMKPTSASSGWFMANGENTVGGYFGGDVYISFDDGGGVDWTLVLALDVWHSIAFTISADALADVELYIDGVSQGVLTYADTSATIEWIGRSGAVDYDGLMCDFVVWDRELTAADVVTWHNAGRPIWGADYAAAGLDADLVIQCDMDEVSGDRACAQGSAAPLTLTDMNTVLSAEVLL